MDFLTNLAVSLNEFFKTHSDPYISQWFLMDSLYPILAIAIVYNIVVIVGPRIMASKKAFELKGLMIFYNFAVTLLSLYMVVEYAVASVSHPSYSLSCFPVDRAGDARGHRLRNVSWLYFFSKIIELADTMFFILRKKQSQISFLHVYHHTNLVVFGWAGVKVVPTGESYFLALLNSGVHVIMYFYYMMAAMGPQWQKYLWWKRYLTQVQLIQFVLIMLHYAYIALFNQSCDFPRAVLIAYTINGLSFFALFMHFYRLAYKASQKEKAAIAAEKARNDKVAENSNGLDTSMDHLLKVSPRKQD